MSDKQIQLDEERILERLKTLRVSPSEAFRDQVMAKMEQPFLTKPPLMTRIFGWPEHLFSTPDTDVGVYIPDWLYRFFKRAAVLCAAIFIAILLLWPEPDLERLSKCQYYLKQRVNLDQKRSQSNRFSLPPGPGDKYEIRQNTHGINIYCS